MSLEMKDFGESVTLKHFLGFLARCDEDEYRTIDRYLLWWISLETGQLCIFRDDCVFTETVTYLVPGWMSELRFLTFSLNAIEPSEAISIAKEACIREVV